ncbi:hypothetical protein QBC44DRAFT_372280 [Cladorrhinum sp. PSN332]|nr:hypothetical protein QBC44DRAFT_372280 [Cladorrhinum sp. PSN332]
MNMPDVSVPSGAGEPGLVDLAPTIPVAPAATTATYASELEQLWGLYDPTKTKKNPAAALSTPTTTTTGDLISFSEGDVEEKEKDLIAFSSDEEDHGVCFSNQNLTDAATPLTLAIFGIPVPPAVGIISPNFDKPLPPHPPAPYFPDEESADDTPGNLSWRGRIVVGPISAAARNDWRLSHGEHYWRSKFPNLFSSVFAKDGNEEMYCVLAFRDDEAGAMNALELIRDYPCGGVRMDSWKWVE